MDESEFDPTGFLVSLRVCPAGVSRQVFGSALHAGMQPWRFVHQIVKNIAQDVMDTFGDDARGQGHSGDAFARCGRSNA